MLAAWPDETYRRNARGLRDRQAFEAVRMQAGTLSAAGRSHAEIAPHPRRGPPERQPLARPLASGWAAGAGEPRANRDRPRLSDQQLHDLDQALRPGARAHGFDTDHWTLVRIASVIEQQTGVTYHPGHVWKLLRRRLGWRLQRPARRAIERDEQAIARWVETDWPRIRQKRPPT